MRLEIRIDRGSLQRPKRNGSSLVIEGYAARVHKPGDPLRYDHGNEYRDAGELARIVDQLRGLPVTLGHPAGMIRNGVRARVVGRIDSAWVDGEHAGVRISVTDESAAHDIEHGTNELSLGYETSVDSAGYQRDSRVDHLAIVESARCGSTCALRMDCMSTCSCRKPTTLADRIDRVRRDAWLPRVAREVANRPSDDGRGG